MHWNIVMFAGPWVGPLHVPLAGTSTVSMFNKKVQVDPMFLGDIALHVMDVTFLVRVACHGCLLRVLALDAGALQESSESMGCHCEPSDWHFWATEIYPDG